MGTRMEQRRGTEAEAAAANPILADGELGWERDTHVLKIGDGIRHWLDIASMYVRTRGGDTIIASAVDVVPLALRGMAGQVVDIFSAKTIAGAGFRVDADGIPFVDADRLVKLTELNAEAALRVAETNNRLADVDAEEAARIGSVNAEAAARVAGDALAIQKAVITALGDILVGTGASGVARLAKGADGQILTMVGGNVVWAAAGAPDLTGYVQKAGSTMTGRIRVTDIGTAAGTTINFRQLAGGAYAHIDAGNLFDNGNRVYSASNPPPVSGMTILTASEYQQALATGASAAVSGGLYVTPVGDLTFVAPANGKVKITSRQNGDASKQAVWKLSSESWSLGLVLQRAANYGSTGPSAPAIIPISGLTPGATYTVNVANYSNNIYASGAQVLNAYFAVIVEG